MIISGSTEAFEALYYRYFTPLCRTAFKRIQNEAIVEELVQDVFINLWVKRGELDALGEIAAYLYATLRNKVLHKLRSEMIRAGNQAVMKLETADAYVPDSSRQLIAKETEEKIQLVLQGLSPKCREAFTLSRFEQLSYKAIAKQMNISVNTVEKHVGKALGYLRRQI